MFGIHGEVGSRGSSAGDGVVSREYLDAAGGREDDELGPAKASLLAGAAAWLLATAEALDRLTPGGAYVDPRRAAQAGNGRR
jgi:hypothetical protein